ncbi:hypothetical protein L0156_26495 [bacterium]|nr:hypothetical protein [bacterium]
MKFRKLLILQTALFTVLSFFFVGSRLTAVMEKERNHTNRVRSSEKFVKGQLIVKYKDTVTACVHCLLKGHRHFKGVTTNANGSLDELNARYELESATPVFRTEEEEKGMIGAIAQIPVSLLRQYHRQKLEIAKAKFANRTNRAPQDASLPDLHHIYVLKFPEYVDLAAAMAEFQRDPHIDYAQPDYLLTTDFLPNDPFYKSAGSWRQNYDDLWGLKADKLDMAPAWDVTQGEGMIVAVVDTGLDYNHPDIATNVWKNQGEIAGNGTDDDRNGFVDDSRGWIS